MKCRQCGAEIADKALVCYKCGTATTEPTFKPPVAKTGSSWLTLVVSALALALLAILAIYLGRIPPNGATSGSLSWIIVGVAVLVVVLRAVGRRIGRR
jgi:hypothetical protein